MVFDVILIAPSTNIITLAVVKSCSMLMIEVVGLQIVMYLKYSFADAVEASLTKRTEKPKCLLAPFLYRLLTFLRMLRYHALFEMLLVLQKYKSSHSELNEPSLLRRPTGKALKPLLLFKLWSLPGAPTNVELSHPVLEAIALAILFSVVVAS